MKFKTYWLLYLAMMCVGMGQTVIFAVMPMLGRELGLHQLIFDLPVFGRIEPRELMITLLSALTALTFSLVTPYWGHLSDRIGRKPVIVFGLLGYTVGMVLFSGTAWLGLQGIASGMVLFGLLVIMRLVHSLVMSAAMPASNAYIVDITHESQRSRGLGRLSAFMQIGVMCGPALAWLMTVHYLAPFLVQAMIMLAMGLIVAFYFPYHKPEIHHHNKPRLRYLDSRFVIYLMLALSVYSGVAMVQQTLGFYFQDVLHLNAVDAARHYALSMVFSSAAMLFAQLYLVKRLDVSPHQLIRIGLPSIVMGFVCLSLAGSLPVLVLGMALFGLGMGLASPSFSAAASFTVTRYEQGALAGLMGSVAGMGFVIGPLLGGLVYSFSSRLTYDLAALLVGFSLIYVLFRKLPGESLPIDG